MLRSVLDSISFSKLNHQLVDLRLEQKCDKNKFVFKGFQEARASLFLKQPQSIKVLAELLDVGFPRSPMLLDLVPHTINKRNLVRYEVLVSQ